MNPKLKAAIKTIPGVTPLVAIKNDLRLRYLGVRHRLALPPETRRLARAVRHLLQVGQKNISRPAEISVDAPVTLMCQGGYRGTIAASLLLNAGYQDVVNLEGGYGAVTAEKAACTGG